MRWHIKTVTGTTARTFGIMDTPDPISKLHNAVYKAIHAKGNLNRDLRLAELKDMLEHNAQYIDEVMEDDYRNSTMLNDAVRYADISVVNILLDSGADPTVLSGMSDCQHTCLFTCCSYPRDPVRLAIAETLLNRGLDVNTQMPDPICIPGYEICNPYSKALHYACFERNYEFVKLFLKHHANVHALDSAGMTPLEVAVTPNYTRNYDEDLLPIIIALVEAGADLYAIDKFGRTLLHRSVSLPYQGYHLDVIRYLVNAGVPDICTLNGMTASDVAVADCAARGENSIRMAGKLCTDLQIIFKEYRQRLVAFAIGNRQHGGIASRRIPGAHTWRRIANRDPDNTST